MSTKQLLAMVGVVAIFVMVFHISKNTKTLSASSKETKQIYTAIENDERGISE